MRGTKRMCFVIGGPEGSGPGVRSRADRSMSLSRMTFPHEFAQAILLEQLYRAFTIIRGEPYHK
jgi:23S rRNA (pseudouridine1915-N3)-methyltransferase